MLAKYLCTTQVRNLKPHIIDEHFIAKYSIISDDKEQGASQQKTRNNGYWVNASIEAANILRMYKLLYIDGPEARTTRVALGAHFNTSDCTVASNNFNAVLVAKLNECNAYLGTPMQVLRKFDIKDKFTSVWYDGCQTLLGNGDIIPKIELDYIIRNNMQSGSVLAVTFCTRGRQRGLRLSLKRVGDIITTAGYGFELIEKNSYPTAMAFYMVKLK